MIFVKISAVAYFTKGVNLFLSVVLKFTDQFVNTSIILDLYVMPLKNLLRCVKIGAFKAILYSGRQSNFDPNFSIFLPIGCTSEYKY